MPRRMTESPESPQRFSTQVSKNTLQNFQPGIHPFLKIIISISLLFLGTVSYQSFQGIIQYQQITKNAAKNCLVDFSKNNCNVANPTEVCKPLIECATSKGDSVMAWIQIIIKEIQQNYMLPMVAVSLLLIYRLCDILSLDKPKKE